MVRQDAFENQYTHDNGSVNLNLVTAGDADGLSSVNEQKSNVPSNFDATPWNDQDSRNESLIIGSKSSAPKKKKKKKAKRKVPKYPQEGYRLESKQEFESFYEKMYWAKMEREDEEP